MEPNLDRERRQAHALLDMLPAEKLSAVRSLLEVMVEHLARSLALAPVEEEGLTPDTAAALDRARFTRSQRGHPARRNPARIRPEAVSEDAAPGAHCGHLVARGPRRSEGRRSGDRNSDSPLR